MTIRIPALSDDHAPAAAQPILAATQRALGMVPNLHRTLAHAPAVLKAYAGMTEALSQGALSAQLREQIAVTTAGSNGCAYCASAHTLLGSNAGLGADELDANLRGQSADPQTQQVLTSVQALMDHTGDLSDEELDALRSAGLGDTEILEIVAHVGMNIFTNMVNRLARTEIDFPLVQLNETEGSLS